MKRIAARLLALYDLALEYLLLAFLITTPFIAAWQSQPNGKTYNSLFLFLLSFYLFALGFKALSRRCLQYLFFGHTRRYLLNAEAAPEKAKEGVEELLGDAEAVKELESKERLLYGWGGLLGLVVNIVAAYLVGLILNAFF